MQHCGIASRLIKTAPLRLVGWENLASQSLSGEIFDQIETNTAIAGFPTKPEHYYYMAINYMAKHRELEACHHHLDIWRGFHQIAGASIHQPLR